MSFSKVFLGNSACFLGVFEKNTATAMFQNSAKYHELQLRERPGTPTLPPNCLAHIPSRHSFWDRNLLQIHINFLGFEAHNIQTNPFFFSPRPPNCRPHESLHNFLGVYICCIFCKILVAFWFRNLEIFQPLFQN